ncbi:hypothetical protein JZ751_009654, partial [Albula glossodonta]
MEPAVHHEKQYSGNRTQETGPHHFLPCAISSSAVLFPAAGGVTVGHSAHITLSTILLQSDSQPDEIFENKNGMRCCQKQRLVLMECESCPVSSWVVGVGGDASGRWRASCVDRRSVSLLAKRPPQLPWHSPPSFLADRESERGLDCHLGRGGWFWWGGGGGGWCCLIHIYSDDSGQAKRIISVFTPFHDKCHPSPSLINNPKTFDTDPRTKDLSVSCMSLVFLITNCFHDNNRDKFTLFWLKELSLAKIYHPDTVFCRSRSKFPECQIQRGGLSSDPAAGPLNNGTHIQVSIKDAKIGPGAYEDPRPSPPMAL